MCIVEIVDTAEKIEAFLPVIDGAIKDRMATVERVQIRFYRSGKDYVVDASFSGIATLVLYLYMENLIKNLK